MKTLLLHPDDSPRHGPWTVEKWDCIVDLGKSSKSAADAWQQMTGAAVIRLSDFQHAIEDPRLAGKILGRWFGKLLDRFGLDWWELTSIFVHPDLETAIALLRLIRELPRTANLHATRSAWPVSGLAQLVNGEIRNFRGNGRAGSDRLRRLSGAFQRLSGVQILDILWDKYDADYRFRGRLARRHQPCSKPVVLLPTAYTNVSRSASAYARLLPEQEFLLVATRNSGLRFDRPVNVQTARLEEFAAPKRDRQEWRDLEEVWTRLQEQFAEVPEMAMLQSSRALAPISGLIRSGLAVRDAWIHVFEREPVTAVLCGDDSNWYTRIPVFLARMRNLPTLDFHHGAFDGRFLLKRLSSDLYLAKNEMEKDYLVRACGLPVERVMVGGANERAPVVRESSPGARRNILFFSEAFENMSARPEEIYRELLPVLYQLAQQQGRRLLVKLHPFENAAERSRLVKAALGAAGKQNVEIVSGPTTPGLLASAWFGIAVESSAVVDCVSQGVPCFHCGWLSSTSFGYTEQYARFGVGRLLRSLEEVLEIPRLLDTQDFSTTPSGLDSPTAAEILKRWLTRQDSEVLSESR